MKLLRDSKMTREFNPTDGTEIVDWEAAEVVKGLKSGEIDVAFFVIWPDSPIVRDLLQTDGIQLMNFRRAAAYQRRYPLVQRIAA